MTTSAPSRPDLRPLVVAGVTAVVSLGLVVAAARWGWMGEDVGRGGRFCEAPRTGWIRQPANTWSNLAFVVAGLAVAWYATDRTRLGLTLGAHPGLATAYAVLVVLLGPGSMAMHATQSDLGGHLDLLSMFLVSAFALAYALMRLVHRGPAFLALVFLVAVVAGMAVQLRGGSVPLLGHVGNAAFGLQLLAAVAVEVALVRRRSARQDVRWGLASLTVLSVAFAIWTTGQQGHAWCRPDSLLQQHAAWHTLCAVAAYLLFRHYAAERVVAAPAAVRPSAAKDPAHRR
ncbi:MAG TPA: ceramidase domain-containing protein [Ornithinibacter sp.]|nr:ceramidase domain-containing protein [Ornithinibacter sp.]